MSFTAPTTAMLSGPRSELRRDVSTAPLHEHSGHVVEHLAQQVALAAPALNCTQYGVSVYEVDEDQPVVDVAWAGHSQPGDALYAGLLGLDPKGKGYPWPVTSYDVLPPSVGAFRGVPIPDGARAAVGTDAALMIHRPATGQLWEFWQARQSPTTRAWSASWGGYVPDLAASDGTYRGGLGVSASGLVTASGALRIAEAQSGVIEHALALGVPHVVGGRWSYPAQRCDALGSTSTAPFALHEGQRFRLDPAVDVDGLLLPPDWAGVRRPVHPLCRAIARAAQRWGFVVTDHAGAVIISAEEGLAATHAGAVRGQYVGNPWGPILGTARAWSVLAGFPWQRLQALPHGWGLAA